LRFIAGSWLSSCAGGAPAPRLGDDADGFLERAKRHRHVDRERLAHGEHQALPLERPEVGELRGKAITPGGQLRREVAPVGAARHFTIEAGLLVGDDDVDTRQGTALIVEHPATDFRGALLSERGCGEGEKEGEDRTNQATSHLRPPCMNE
jgi:hypothetical protein